MPETLNHLLTRLFDGLLLPVSSSPGLALVCLALLLGALVAKILPRLSPQLSLVRISQQTRAELLAMRLFADQPLNFIRCFVRILWLSLLRIGCVLPACLLLLPVGLLIAAQLEMRFARRPMETEETVLVRLQLLDSAVNEEIYATELSCDPPLHIVQGPLRDETSGTLYWNIAFGSERSSQSNVYLPKLHFELPSGSFSIPVVIADPKQPLPAVINCWSNQFSNRLWFACPRVWKPTLPVKQVSIEYQDRDFEFAGFTFPWWSLFLGTFFLGSCLVLWWRG